MEKHLVTKAYSKLMVIESCSLLPLTSLVFPLSKFSGPQPCETYFIKQQLKVISKMSLFYFNLYELFLFLFVRSIFLLLFVFASLLSLRMLYAFLNKLHEDLITLKMSRLCCHFSLPWLENKRLQISLMVLRKAETSVSSRYLCPFKNKFIHLEKTLLIQA